MTFKTPLILQAGTQPDVWIVYEPLVWQDSHIGSIVVPKGFQTDLASIPRILRNVPSLDQNGLSRRPAVLHDYLYTQKNFSKEYSDVLFYDALRDEGASVLLAQALYDAVRLFGGQAWSKDQSH